jgi:transcriptional regulator with XRE-family HTH domain
MKLIATPNQIRAARVLLGMSQLELAKEAGVNAGTLSIVERTDEPRNSVSRDKVQQALEEKLGIEFLAETESSGDGIRYMLPFAKRPARFKADQTTEVRAKRNRKQAISTSDD